MKSLDSNMSDFLPLMPLRPVTFSGKGMDSRCFRKVCSGQFDASFLYKSHEPEESSLGG
jgi:hypothetical protein